MFMAHGEVISSDGRGDKAEVKRKRIGESVGPLYWIKDVARQTQQREWFALGKALKDLRDARSLAQKTVVGLLGNEMSDRTLRAYEAGEERPGRDRLLRILVQVFELKRIDEIDRHLQLARYVKLTSDDIERYELQPSYRDPAPEVGGPANFRLEASTLIVTDGQNKEIWRHQFPARLLPEWYEGQSAVRRVAFADIDGDGHIETVFVNVAFDHGSVGTPLICFSGDGQRLWEFTPRRTVRDNTGREYLPPYFINNVQVIPIAGLGSRILVSSNHYLHNPNQVAMLDPGGALVSEYWHSGHLLYTAHADLNGDGIEEILLAGVNNGYGQATIVVFDARNVNGASKQPGRQILGFASGTEKAVVLFPKTCLAQNAPYNRVKSLWITQERRITVAVVEGVSEARNPGEMIYELDFGLNVSSARPDSHLQENHRILESQGILDHSWTEEESERMRRGVVVRGRL
jgi:transcriptional regulator with XRE-family HTH domain